MSFHFYSADNNFFSGLRENEAHHLYNITAGIRYGIHSYINNQIIEIRFFFPKKQFNSNPNPFTIILSNNDILKTYQDSNKEYYSIYGSYSLKDEYGNLYLHFISNKDIASCIVIISSVNDTSLPGKLVFFGIIVFCILIFLTTILKTKACGDFGEKSENSSQLQNVPIQPEPQINIQNNHLLIEP